MTLKRIALEDAGDPTSRSRRYYYKLPSMEFTLDQLLPALNTIEPHESDNPLLMPPVAKTDQASGRPAKMRKTRGGFSRRKGAENRCGKCGMRGHKKNKCPGLDAASAARSAAHAMGVEAAVGASPMRTRGAAAAGAAAAAVEIFAGMPGDGWV